jgi:hypothetical protein
VAVDGVERDIGPVGDVLHGGGDYALFVVELESGVDDAPPCLFDALRALP